MTQDQIMKLALAGAVLFAAHKWGNGAVKAGAIAVASVAVAKRIPYVNEVI